MSTHTARTMLRMLEQHYLPAGRFPAGVFAAEVESPCGTRRADLLWIPTTHGAAGIVGHEIKISRADVLAELADPTKADPWLQYCARWWLVLADGDLIAGLDIPAPWGILAPPAGRNKRTMTVVRPAPALRPINPEPAYRRLLKWQMVAYRDTIERQGNETAHLRALADRQKQTAEERAARAAGAPISPYVRRIQALIAKADDRLRRDFSLHVDAIDETVIAAIVDAAAARAAADRVRKETADFVAGLETELAPLRYARETVARSLKARLAGRPAAD